MRCPCIRDSNIKALDFLVSIQREAEKLDDAAVTLQETIVMDPNNAERYFHLGVVLETIGRRDEAEKAMRKAIEINPQHANALNYLGYTYSEQGVRLDEAESLVKRALEVDPDNGYYLDSLAWIHYQREDYQHAHAAVLKALDVVPNDAVILEHYAEILVKLGESRKALAVFEQALSHAPESDDQEAIERITDRIADLRKTLR